MTVCAGVDGCKGGWIAVWRGGGALPETMVFECFEEIIAWLPMNAVIAVDMPIGLPETGTPLGRAAERAARPTLTKRRSSIFAIPSRAAVYAVTGPIGKGGYIAAHALASAEARRTSSPPAGVSIQAFGIFPKIREIDRLLRDMPALRQRAFESHPEIAFMTLNGGREMSWKKSSFEGQEERSQALLACGFDASFLSQSPEPRSKAKQDDFLDACILALAAERIARGEAVSYPDPPETDAFGLRISIQV
jgi:predicted RNase H-like nuclease